MKEKGFIDPRYAAGEYRDALGKTLTPESCPLCTLEIHAKPILREVWGWFITESTWPYEHTRYHFLIISKNHREDFAELGLFDFQAIHTLVAWALSEYDIPGGALTLRFGETHFTGATIHHLHFHLIVPELDPATGRVKTVLFPIG